MQSIAATILDGTNIYGTAGAVSRSVAGGFLLALNGNGFNGLNTNPLTWT